MPSYSDEFITEYGISMASLKYAIESDILDVEYINQQISMKKREELLSRHPYSIREKNGVFYTYLPADNKYKRVLKKRNSRKKLEDVIIDYYKSQEQTIEDIFNAWHDRRFFHNCLEESSYVRMRNRFRKVFAYKELSKLPISKLEPKSFAKWLEDVIFEFDMTSKEFRDTKTIVRGIVKYALRDDLINFTPEEVFSRIETNKNTFKRITKCPEEEYFNNEEWDKYFNYLKDSPDSHNLAILLMFASGMRIGEIAVLSPTNIIIPKDSSEPPYIKVEGTEQAFSYGNGVQYKVNNKGKTPDSIRNVIVRSDLVPILRQIRALNPFGDFCFVNEKGERLSTKAIRSRHDRNLKKLGIAHKSPHKIRKTYSTILDENSVDHNFIQSQLGHTDFKTTRDYYIRDRKSRIEKGAVLEGISDFAI